MKLRTISLRGAAVMTWLGLLCTRADAQLPPDFPQLSITTTGNTDPGYLFGSVNANGVPGVSNYFAILDNAANPVYYSKSNSLGKLACNGLFVTIQGTKGQPIQFLLKDTSFNVVATNRAGNGYNADNHDFQVLPNGHALVMIYDNTPIIDMSKIVPGGYPAAVPNQTVIQEIDVENNVIFQWRSLDHIPVTDSYQTLTAPNLGDYIHVNSMWFDETDGSIILSCRNTSEVIKIDRATGETIWRMQGKHNEFAFTNAIPGNTDPAGFQVQHSARRLPNGNLTIFDNGYSEHSDPSAGFLRPYSRAVEYAIDEVNKTARLVWQYRADPDIITYNGGSMERLAGGNTIITWGNENNAPGLAMTEAGPNGELVCKVQLLQTAVSGQFTRMTWPLETLSIPVTKRELAEGNTYVFTDGSKVTGVEMLVTSLDGDIYNDVTVTREPFAPVLPRFQGQSPRVQRVRLIINASAINSMSAQLSFNVSAFALADPTNTTVYYRQTPGQGLFVPLTTQYNWVTHQLQTVMDGFGEFIFGFPDLAEVPYPPLLVAPASDEGVNQQLPVALFWTPKGFAHYYQLQVSKDEDFSTRVVDETYLPECRYTLSNPDPNTRYYWRVKTSNYGGDSDWSVGSFQTTPPAIEVTVPDGGETFPRGLTSIIQWKDNLAEKVVIDLYKSGVFLKSLATNNSTGAYQWQVGLDLVPASDYAIKISSATNAAVSDISDSEFSIDVPKITSVQRNPDGALVLGWSGSSTSVYIEFKAALNPGQWETIGGPTAGPVWTNAPQTSAPGFYRLRSE